MLQVTQDNYFEAAQALYWYCKDYHGGMSSGILSQLDYNPSFSECGVNDDDDSNEFYQELENGGIEAMKLFDDIQEILTNAKEN